MNICECGCDKDLTTSKECPICRDVSESPALACSLTEHDARTIFESFDGPLTFQKDKFDNYTERNVHNLWVGFKNWRKNS